MKNQKKGKNFKEIQMMNQKQKKINMEHRNDPKYEKSIRVINIKVQDFLTVHRLKKRSGSTKNHKRQHAEK